MEHSSEALQRIARISAHLNPPKVQVFSPLPVFYFVGIRLIFLVIPGDFSVLASGYFCGHNFMLVSDRKLGSWLILRKKLEYFVLFWFPSIFTQLLGLNCVISCISEVNFANCYCSSCDCKCLY